MAEGLRGGGPVREAEKRRRRRPATIYSPLWLFCSRGACAALTGCRLGATRRIGGRCAGGCVRAAVAAFGAAWRIGARFFRCVGALRFGVQHRLSGFPALRCGGSLQLACSTSASLCINGKKTARFSGNQGVKGALEARLRQPLTRGVVSSRWQCGRIGPIESDSTDGQARRGRIELGSDLGSLRSRMEL